MRGLTSREKALLGFCFFTLFVVLNFFAIRWAMKAGGGGDAKIRQLKNELADYEMWLQAPEKWNVRDQWLAENMPILEGNAIGKAQGNLIQQLQDELFKRKIKIDRQSLQEPKSEIDYTEVSVKFDLRGEADTVVDWLSTLQGPDKFVVVKYLELELDTKSKEPEPQAKVEIIIANWYRPEESDLPDGPAPETQEAPVEVPAPTAPETQPQPEPENTEQKTDATGAPKKEVAVNEPTGSIR